MDGVSIYAALMVAYFAAHDWYGFTLPLFSQGQLMSWQATLLAVACAVTSLSIGYFNGRERFLTPTGKQRCASSPLAKSSKWPSNSRAESHAAT